MPRKGQHTPGAETVAKQQWCNDAAQRVIAELESFLAPPVSDTNKDEVLKQIQNWIVRERRVIANRKAQVKVD